MGSKMTAFDKAWDICKEIQYTEGGMHTCPMCEGRGEITYTVTQNLGAAPQMDTMTCYNCNGTGQITSEKMIQDKEDDAEWCSCPEYRHGKVYGRGGGLVPASREQLDDWEAGVHLIEGEDEEGPYSYTVCGTCNGIVTAG